MSSSYQRFASVCAILAGVAGLLYLIFFLALRDPAALLPSLALLAVGLLSLAVIAGLYERLREFNEGFALLGLVLGAGGALGATVHAAFDLSNNLHPPAAPFNYPSPVDPRGVLTFAVTGLAVLTFSWLVVRSGLLPRSVGYFGIVSGVLLVLLYAAYLVILSATNPVVLFLVLVSGVAQPVWYLWIGWALRQGAGVERPLRNLADRR